MKRWSQVDVCAALRAEGAKVVLEADRAEMARKLMDASTVKVETQSPLARFPVPIGFASPVCVAAGHARFAAWL